MISKISDLKSKTSNEKVQSLCESSISALSSIIYNNVTPDARYEIERVSLENLFEELSKYPSDKVIVDWLSNQKRLYSVKNIGVRKAVNNLSLTESKYNPTLGMVLENFKEQLDNNIPEVLLYETFISACSGFSYLPAVNTELDAVASRVKQYKNDIDITKIIETMKDTRSNYLLPLIEDVVNNYLNNKTEDTKHFLKETLVKFSYDPFIRDIINLIVLDATNLQLEYANAEVGIDKVYSPLVYLGESETLFNVKCSYYIKKGNNINKIKKEDVSKLDENFINLCEAINLSNVVFDKDIINVYVGKDKAQISAKGVQINEQFMDNDQFKQAAGVSQWAGNTQFYALTESLRNNFDEIAEVDFVKRVYLKENEGIAADIFKLRDNVFITTYDSINAKTTFYRNINPIQAEKIMMEHLRYDVSKTFSDLLPNKEKILSQINETKQEYSNYINVLDSKIKEFNEQGNNEVVVSVLEALNEELDEVKNEYKDYLNEVERYIRPNGENLDETVIITVDVDGKQYTVPIPVEASTARGETSGEQSTGTEVGAENVADQEPASEITFNDEESELLSDNPSIEQDKVDLGADETGEEVEDLEAEKKEKESLVEPNKPTETTGEEGSPATGGEETNPGETFGDETTTSTETSGEETTPETGASDELNVSDVENTESEEEKPEEKSEETEEESDEEKEGKTEESLQRTPYVKEESTEKKPMKVFLKKKKVQESVVEKKKLNKLNECQVGDTVILDGQKGYVTGQTSDGDLIVMVQYATHKVKPSAIKEHKKKSKEALINQFKFDEKTKKLLFEQFVKCGIYVNNTPVKINDCYVRFCDFTNANPEQAVNVIIENSKTYVPKSQIRIFEDMNDFANTDNYVEAVIIDQNTGEALENVLINAIDYTNAIGDADLVRTIINRNGEQEIQSYPASMIKTLSI
jgi:hypothetical protein